METLKTKIKLKVKKNIKSFDNTLLLDKSIIMSLNYILIYQNNQLDNHIKQFIMNNKNN